MRLIDADALMDMVADTIDRIGNTCVLMNAKDFVRNYIDNQPTIDQKKLCEMCRIDDCIALTQKKGKWERPVVRGLTCLTALCSVCGYVNNNNDGFKYCPNCGASMERSENE